MSFISNSCAPYTSLNLNGNLIGVEPWNANVETLRLKEIEQSTMSEYCKNRQPSGKKFTQAIGLDQNTINYSTFI
ncbi:hypothetical protein BT93_A1128 [Corymbia citriodora subsp. variegata]|nr:hypothetical protein BT93_A1128 [Corymbia citriodora subsp. variegata]